MLLLVVALVATLAATAPGPAQAADDKGLANGVIAFPQRDHPGIKMLWFDRDWHYLGQKAANGGGYSVWLQPGSYHLQFVDQRPSYDLKKYAPTDISVTVRPRDITTKNVRMQPGAAITGVARAGGKALRGATIYAARTDERSFPTVADKKGRFAVGGLPEGRYCLFTFDKAKRWVDKCTWVGAVQAGKARNQDVVLRKPAGNLTVYLFTPNGRMRSRAAVTVTSKQTGQWWTATARDGTAVFRGLHPGGYTLRFTGAGVWLPRTASVQRATVRSGAMAFGRFEITQRGGWVTGTIVDGGDTITPMVGAQVWLFDRDDRLVASAVSGPDGAFTLQGQLTTQAGMTLVAAPKADGGGWMQGALWCRFDQSAARSVDLVTGQETWVGNVSLPRWTGSDQAPQCLPSGRTGRHSR